jgi:hypothetical protein
MSAESKGNSSDVDVVLGTGLWEEVEREVVEVGKNKWDVLRLKVCEALNGVKRKRFVLTKVGGKNSDVTQDAGRQLQRIKGVSILLKEFDASKIEHVMFKKVNARVIDLYIIPLKPGEVCFLETPLGRSGDHTVSIEGPELTEWRNRLGNFPWKRFAYGMGRKQEDGVVKTILGRCDAGTVMPDENEKLDYKYRSLSLYLKKQTFRNDRESLFHQCCLKDENPPICKLVLGVHDVTRAAIGVVAEQSEVCSWMKKALLETFPKIPLYTLEIKFDEIVVPDIQDPVYIVLQEKLCPSALVYFDGKALLLQQKDGRIYEDPEVDVATGEARVLCVERAVMKKAKSRDTIRTCPADWREHPVFEDLESMTYKGHKFLDLYDVQGEEKRFVISIELTLDGELEGVPVWKFGENNLALWLRCKGYKSNMNLCQALLGSRFYHLAMDESCKSVVSHYIQGKSVVWHSDQDLRPFCDVVLVISVAAAENFRWEKLSNTKPLRLWCLLVAQMNCTMVDLENAKREIERVDGGVVMDVVGDFYEPPVKISSSNVPLASDLSDKTLSKDELFKFLRGEQQLSFEMIKAGGVPMTEQTKKFLQKISKPVVSRCLIFRLVKTSFSCGASTMITQMAYALKQEGNAVFLWNFDGPMNWEEQLSEISGRWFVFLDTSRSKTEAAVAEIRRIGTRRTITLVFVEKLSMEEEEKSDSEFPGLLIDPFLTPTDINALCGAYLSGSLKKKTRKHIEALRDNQSSLVHADRHVFMFGLLISFGKFLHVTKFVEACREEVGRIPKAAAEFNVSAFLKVFAGAKISTRLGLEIQKSFSAEVHQIIRFEEEIEEPVWMMDFSHVFFARQWLKHDERGVLELWREASEVLTSTRSGFEVEKVLKSVLVFRENGDWFSPLLLHFVNKRNELEFLSFMTSFGGDFFGPKIEPFKDLMKSRVYRCWAMMQKEDPIAADFAAKAIACAQLACKSMKDDYERMAKHNLLACYVSSTQVEYAETNHINKARLSQGVVIAVELCDSLYGVENQTESQKQSVVKLALKIEGVEKSHTVKWLARRKESQSLDYVKFPVKKGLLKAMHDWE